MTSSAGAIEIAAATKIVLQAGRATITLEAGNITFACPGQFSVKGATHQWPGPKSEAALLPHLPRSETRIEPTDAEFRYAYHDGELVQGARYVAAFSDGSTRTGRLDAHGFTSLTGVPPGAIDVCVGSDARPYCEFLMPLKADDALAEWFEA